MTSSDFQPIQTARLLIRPLKIEDAPDIFLIRGDPEIMKYSASKVETDESQTLAWVQSKIAATVANPATLGLVIELLPNARVATFPLVIGTMAIKEDGELGYMFNRLTWGRGYASEAVAAFTNAFWTFAPEGTEMLQASIDEGNIGSRKVLERAGFVYLETLEKAFDSPVMGWRDSVIYQKKRPAS